VSESQDKQDNALIVEWQQKIAIADRDNIFCHCRNCHTEWIDSTFDTLCTRCGSADVERISCWQFPDD
jgi:Zn finger protein HypA/HybF involved in hydrogenase expression